MHCAVSQHCKPTSGAYWRLLFSKEAQNTLHHFACLLDGAEAGTAAEEGVYWSQCNPHTAVCALNTLKPAGAYVKPYSCRHCLTFHSSRSLLYFHSSLTHCVIRLLANQHLSRIFMTKSWLKGQKIHTASSFMALSSITNTTQLQLLCMQLG